MYKGLLSVFFSFLLFLTAISASAQQPGPTPDQFDSDTSQDDVLILVNVTAKELRFDAVPNTTVEFPGKPRRTTIWLTQRQNLPEKVEPGVTYRDIGIQLRISSRFADIERIVQEALGEVPVEDLPTSKTPPSTTKSPTSLTASAKSKSPVARRFRRGSVPRR